MGDEFVRRGFATTSVESLLQRRRAENLCYDSSCRERSIRQSSGGDGGSSISKANMEPSDGVVSTSSTDPIAPTSFRQIASPSPLPENVEVLRDRRGGNGS